MTELAAFREIEISCECRVNGERLYALQTVPEAVWRDSEAREAIIEAVRQRLMMAVLDRWKPKVQVRR